ncbi:MAG: glycosyltransferase [Bryobacterales bacterium]|nr:glycosyltransferase [Bryobacteraceae bacterium]MDW8131948.1 glycosyltransferase [Bryobacterales bacterium]
MEELLNAATAEAGADRHPAPAQRLGERLVTAGLITKEQLARALAIQRESGSRLGQILMAEGWIRALPFYRELAAHLGLPFIDLIEQPPDPQLFDPSRMQEYARQQYLPWRRGSRGLVIAVAEPDDSLFDHLRREHGPEVEFVLTSKFDILWSLQTLARPRLLESSVMGRWWRSPEHSAMKVVTRSQLAVITVAGAAGLAWLLWSPTAALVTANLMVGLLLLGSFLLRALLVWSGSSRLYQARSTQEELAALDPATLPVYTILVPLYRDAAVVPVLARALRSLDYPRAKLDIKLILEEDDRQTIEACKQAGLEANVELVLVPPALPRTKPKALNYALNFARGELLTIYDAEDIPEPDQLKKAVLAFRKAPPEVVCLQARLNYYNWKENWLTRMFTLEYSLWFDWYLPGLEALGIPIPLGGTSNHFRIEVIRAVGGWDPFNVTEDADLGVRFTMSRWRVGMLDSTTLEEANSRVGNWIRQRSRWVKGYLLTWLVYMRHPWRTLRRLGWKGFLGFQAFVGGAFLGPLVFPPLAAMYLFWLVTRSPLLDAIFPSPVLAVALLTLLIGNGFLIYFHMLAAWHRGLHLLVFCAAQLPLYYLLMSLAAWKGLWQLVTRPHYWEKTEHGLSELLRNGGYPVHA